MSSYHFKRDNYKSDMQKDRLTERRHSRSRSPVHRFNRRPRSCSRSHSPITRPSRKDHHDRESAHTSRISSRNQSVSCSNSRSISRQRVPCRTRELHNRISQNSACGEILNVDGKFTKTCTDNIPEQVFTHNVVENFTIPKIKDTIGAYYNLDTDQPIDKEKIHREMEEKLRAALAKEGKIYPPPKPEPSHPVFANDGSFIEIFKKMQDAQNASLKSAVNKKNFEPSAFVYAEVTSGKVAPPPPTVGRRRGGKILKTGLVAKPKAQGEDNSEPKDFWAIYLQEVNKYKNNACESDGGTRPLVK